MSYKENTKACLPFITIQRYNVSVIRGKINIVYVFHYMETQKEVTKFKNWEQYICVLSCNYEEGDSCLSGQQWTAFHSHTRVALQSWIVVVQVNVIIAADSRRLMDFWELTSAFTDNLEEMQ